MEATASAVIANLQLSKIFSHLLSELQQVSNFNHDLMFILTPTGSINNEGTSRFIDHLQSNLKERIRMVICLDHLVNWQHPGELTIIKGLVDND